MGKSVLHLAQFLFAGCYGLQPGFQMVKELSKESVPTVLAFEGRVPRRRSRLKSGLWIEGHWKFFFLPGNPRCSHAWYTSLKCVQVTLQRLGLRKMASPCHQSIPISQDASRVSTGEHCRWRGFSKDLDISALTHWCAVASASHITAASL